MFIDNQKYPLRTYFARHKKTERLKVQKLEAPRSEFICVIKSIEIF